MNFHIKNDIICKTNRVFRISFWAYGRVLIWGVYVAMNSKLNRRTPMMRHMNQCIHICRAFELAFQCRSFAPVLVLFDLDEISVIERQIALSYDQCGFLNAISIEY